MANASRDSNYVPTLIAVSSADGTTPIKLYADPTTNRLLVSGGSFADGVTPTGSINGSNVTFTLANAPSPALSLILVLNGAVQTAGGVDYTLSSTTITFLVAPPTTSTLRAWHRY